MSDIMMFPKTVDEFMEQYKIVDTDKVYTNGAELVPIFRMKQWFEHETPIRHGHWEDTTVLFYRGCSECGCYIKWNYEPFLDIGEYNYCPNCGAKMREVEDDD